VRNIAAHHGRLWNRVLGVQPVRPNNGPWQHMAALYPTDRMYFTLQVLRALLMCSAADAEAWCNQVSNHLRPLLATSENRRSMGALPGWEEHPLWRI